MTIRSYDIPDIVFAAFEDVKDEFESANVHLEVDTVVTVDYIPNIVVEGDVDSVEEWHEKEEVLRDIMEEYDESEQIGWRFRKSR